MTIAPDPDPLEPADPDGAPEPPLSPTGPDPEVPGDPEAPLDPDVDPLEVPEELTLPQITLGGVDPETGTEPLT